MRVVVKKKPFKGSPVGAEIELARRDARVLIAIGRAEVPQPEVVAAEVVVDEAPKREKRQYRRRDMTAED